MSDAPLTPHAPDPAVVAALDRMGLTTPGCTPIMHPLTGGVSSDIWKVQSGDRTFCIKRALPKLKVAQDWQAPIERSRYEYLWLQEAGRIVPDSVPRLYGYDEQLQLIALEWLDPATYKWWKGELRDGHVDRQTAAALGRALGQIHAGTASRPDIAARFPTDDIFFAIRLEPYLVATARAHPDLASHLLSLVRITASTRRSLVHGDVSPKNILVGPKGPVLLDAECAWYGDPAFDLAFCLNHLLLKCLWTPRATNGFLEAFDSLAAAYLSCVAWEEARALEARVAGLLPGLLLARIDGKSPVEYVTDNAVKQLVRGVAGKLLRSPASVLADVRASWSDAIDRSRTSHAARP